MAISRETRFRRWLCQTPLVIPPFPLFFSNYHVLHIQLPMSTLHSKSVIARAAFPFVRPRELSFNLPSCSTQILPLPAYVAPTGECTGRFLLFFFLNPLFPFYFYFTYARTRTRIHLSTRCKLVNNLAVITLTRNRLSGPYGRTHLFFRATPTRHAKKLQFEKQKTKKKKQSQVLHSP